MRLDVKGTAKEVYRVILRDLSAYGGFPFYGVMVISAMFLGAFSIAYALLVSLVAVTVVIILIRLAYFRPRPGMKKKNYDTFYSRIDNSSFPSIHAARAVMISVALYSIFSALLPLLPLLILAVCLSRIEFKRHHASDIVAGLAVGLVLGYLFFLL